MPRGPLGTPRPIATSSINLKFYGDGNIPSEIVIETQLRQYARESGIDSIRNVDVVVNSGAEPDTHIITLVTGVDLINFQDIHYVKEELQNITKSVYDRHDMEISAT